MQTNTGCTNVYMGLACRLRLDVQSIHGLSMQTNTGCINVYIDLACRLTMDAQTYIWA